MKIIKKGIPPENKTFEVTCRKCKSELECTPIDIIACIRTITAVDGSGMSKIPYTAIECPVCMHKIEIQYDSIKFKNVKIN